MKEMKDFLAFADQDHGHSWGIGNFICVGLLENSLCCV